MNEIERTHNDADNRRMSDGVTHPDEGVQLSPFDLDGYATQLVREVFCAMPDGEGNSNRSQLVCCLDLVPSHHDTSHCVRSHHIHRPWRVFRIRFDSTQITTFACISPCEQGLSVIFDAGALFLNRCPVRPAHNSTTRIAVCQYNTQYCMLKIISTLYIV